MSQTAPLAETNSEGKVGVGRMEVDFYRLWEGSQQDILPASGVVSV